MKFLATLALLTLGVAYAHHTPQHKLGYPEFQTHKTHIYDVTINMTSGVAGLHPQVSKAVIKASLKIHALRENEVLVMMERVLVSNSLAGVESQTEKVDLQPNRELEALLKIPIKAVFESGKVKRYSLSHLETLESKKIKKTILRNLEVHIDRKYLQGDQKSWPIMYNKTRSSPAGSYYSHYVVTSSPYDEFPMEQNVFNITRTDNFEVVPYLAYKSHHNFEKQGCPEVCKMNHTENAYGGGCPIQHEPYQTPLKRSFVQRHNLRKIKTGITIIDSVSTKEMHVADVYDQNMEIIIRTDLKFVKQINHDIPEPTDQPMFTDLDDFEQEINEPEIEKLCKQPSRKSAIDKVKKLLTQITEVVLQGDIESEKSKEVGEMLVSLQKSSQLLMQEDLRTIQSEIISYKEVSRASEQNKIKRQIWLDLLPVIGTSESVLYIVHLITECVNSPRKELSLWESKSILESLPQNIHEPKEQTITAISTLLEILPDEKLPEYPFFFSATHMAVARVIRSLCAEPVAVPNSVEPQQTNWRLWHRINRSDKNSEYYQNMRRKCPKVVVKKIIDKIIRQLDTTQDKAKRVIYIEALARTGLEEVLPVLRPYVYGDITEEIKYSTKGSPRSLSKSYIDYLKTTTLYSLHNIVEKYPRAVQELVAPVFLNKTEPPKVRIAAFSVLVRSQPTLGTLQLIAEESWREPSEEVGSFITSTLENLGNSTLPCRQLIAERIKKILPRVKRVDRGYQKSKNYLLDLWDEIRGFGLEKQFSFLPSNESFIPSGLYGSLSYTTDTLRDSLFQYALNVQGFTSKNLYDQILKKLGMEPAEDIPKKSEEDIFPYMHISDRDPEFWRLTVYQKLFYSTSYYYFDGEDTSRKNLLDMVIDQLLQYISPDSKGDYNGHLIKVLMPSSYHAKSVAHALPYPVQFEMKNPLLLSLKVRVHKEAAQAGGVGYQINLHPSVYYSTIYTNEILNLGDCKKVGVYHEQKVAATYPVVLSLSVKNRKNIIWSYQFPELPKKIFTYLAEPGTYAGLDHFAPLPIKENRKTIKTLPSEFKKRGSFAVIGLPKLDWTVLTEDIQLGYREAPRNQKEAAIHLIQQHLNAGWRRKSVDVQIISDEEIWIPKTEVRVDMEYSRNYAYPVEKLSSDSDWAKDLKFDDSLEQQDPSSYAREGQAIYKTFTTKLNHIKDSIKVKVEQIAKSSTVKKADLNLDYYHTLAGFLHLVHINASAHTPKRNTPLAVAADYAVAYLNRPDEFRYTEQYGKQKGLAIGAISFSNESPFSCDGSRSVVSKAVFKYKPLSGVLHMNTPVPEKYFEPETHEQCLKDVEEDENLSVPCLKAIREKSIYNDLKVHVTLPKDIPESVYEFAERFDLALKHTYFRHLEIKKETVQPLLATKETVKSLRLEATYIDKMTAEPVVDIVIRKPSETIKLHKVSIGKFQPLSSIESIPEVYAAALTNNTYPATCTLMDKYVRTYDLKTFHLPHDTPECSYVLSTQCTKHKKFAVLVKYSPKKAGTKEIHFYVGKDHIVLVPGTRSSYKIKYNGEEKSVSALASLMLSEPSLITALVNVAYDGKHYVEIKARKAGVMVRYDGSNVKVQIHPRYKGEVCGLCGDFNGEIVREFTGEDRCLYISPTDFAKSYIVGTCGDKAPGSAYMCPNQVFFTDSMNMVPDDEYEPRIKRNVVLNHEDMICFSTKPVPVCDNNAPPTKTESHECEFHCLPKLDSNARRMVTESKRRILGEVETKPVDYTQTIEVAKMC